MKFRQHQMAILVCFALSCLPSVAQQKPVESREVASTEKPLLPKYREAMECLAECYSVWYRVDRESDYPLPRFMPEFPLEFSDLMASIFFKARFIILVGKLPKEHQDVGILGPNDKEVTVATSAGTYTRKPPTLMGSLHNVMETPRGLVYIYSNIFYFRTSGGPTGFLHVAIDPKTRTFAGMFRNGRIFDDYYLIGAEELHGALLAYTAAADMEMTDSTSHFMRAESGHYIPKPIVFPLNKSRDEAIERVRLFNRHLSVHDQALGVPQPNYSGQLR